MNVLSRKVVIRAFEERDLPFLYKWANDPELWRCLGDWHFPSSIGFQRQWLQSLQADALNRRFAVDAPDVGLIGSVNLKDIDWKNSHASTGLYLGDKNQRHKGYGTDTLMAIMRYAFEELHFQRLAASIIEYNQASKDLFCGKCGWKEEGFSKDWYFRENRYWGKIIVGVTRSDYLALIAENKYWDAR